LQALSIQTYQQSFVDSFLPMCLAETRSRRRHICVLGESFCVTVSIRHPPGNIQGINTFWMAARCCTVPYPLCCKKKEYTPRKLRSHSKAYHAEQGRVSPLLCRAASRVRPNLEAKVDPYPPTTPQQPPIPTPYSCSMYSPSHFPSIPCSLSLPHHHHCPVTSVDIQVLCSASELACLLPY
jgi:hypothetical protein